MCHSPIHPFHVKLNRNFNVLVITPLALVLSGALVTVEFELGVAGKSSCNIECCMHQLAATTQCVSTQKKAYQIQYAGRTRPNWTLLFGDYQNVRQKSLYLSLCFPLQLSVFLFVCLWLIESENTIKLATKWPKHRKSHSSTICMQSVEYLMNLPNQNENRNEN